MLNPSLYYRNLTQPKDTFFLKSIDLATPDQHSQSHYRGRMVHIPNGVLQDVH